MSFAKLGSLPSVAQSFTRCSVAPSSPMTKTLFLLFIDSSMLQFVPEMPETGIFFQVTLEGFHKMEGCLVDILIIVLYIDRWFYIGFISVAFHCDEHRHHRRSCFCSQRGSTDGEEVRTVTKWKRLEFSYKLLASRPIARHHQSVSYTH